MCIENFCLIAIDCTSSLRIILKYLHSQGTWILVAHSGIYLNCMPLNLESELGGCWGTYYHSPWLCYLIPLRQSQQIYVAPDGSYMRNPEMCHFMTLLMHLHKQLNPLYTTSYLYSMSFLSGNDLDVYLISVQSSVSDTACIPYFHGMACWICDDLGTIIIYLRLTRDLAVT